MLGEVLNLLTPVKELFESIRSSKIEKTKKTDEALRALYVAICETRIFIAEATHAAPPYSLRPITPRRHTHSKASLEPFLGSGSGPRRKRSISEAQKRIARLWSDAAIALRSVDKDLARRCVIKSEYWTNPDEWNNDDIRRARIELDRINQEAQDLL